MSVAAVDVTTYNQESYSSEGPTFGPGGACTGGSIEPDISGYANVSTVSYGAGVATGSLVSGYLWQYKGPHMLFLFGSLCAILALIIVVFFVHVKSKKIEDELQPV